MLSLELAHGLFGFEPTFDSLTKGRHGSGGFFGGFLRWIFLKAAKCKRKSAARKSATLPTLAAQCDCNVMLSAYSG